MLTLPHSSHTPSHHECGSHADGVDMSAMNARSSLAKHFSRLPSRIVPNQFFPALTPPTMSPPTQVHCGSPAKHRVVWAAHDPK